MTRYILNQLLRNKILLVWPGMFLVLFLVFLIYATANHMPGIGYVFEIGEAILPAEVVLSVMTGAVLLIILIALPTHLITNIEPGRASLLLSRPVSRTDFFVSDLSAVAIITFGYSFFSIALLALFSLVKGVVFPVPVLMGLAVFPFIVMAYYINILLLALLFKNYLVTVFLCYVFAGLSGLLLNLRDLIAESGVEPGALVQIFEMLQYVIPGAGPASAVSEGFYRAESFAAGMEIVSFGLIVHYLFSLVPFTGWAYYIIKKRQF